METDGKNKYDNVQMIRRYGHEFGWNKTVREFEDKKIWRQKICKNGTKMIDSKKMMSETDMIIEWTKR